MGINVEYTCDCCNNKLNSENDFVMMMINNEDNLSSSDKMVCRDCYKELNVRLGCLFRLMKAEKENR